MARVQRHNEIGKHPSRKPRHLEPRHSDHRDREDIAFQHFNEEHLNGVCAPQSRIGTSQLYINQVISTHNCIAGTIQDIVEQAHHGQPRQSHHHHTSRRHRGISTKLRRGRCSAPCRCTNPHNGANHSQSRQLDHLQKLRKC